MYNTVIAKALADANLPRFEFYYGQTIADKKGSFLEFNDVKKVLIKEKHPKIYSELLRYDFLPKEIAFSEKGKYVNIFDVFLYANASAISSQ